MLGIWGVVSGDDAKRQFIGQLKNDSVLGTLNDVCYFPDGGFGRSLNGKFPIDKAFDTVNGVFVCSDGVIFNLKRVLEKFGCSNLSEILHMFYMSDLKNIKLLRGNFIGIIYEPKSRKTVLFSDHVGSKPLYYYYDENGATLFFSSSLHVISKMMTYSGFSPKLDVPAAYSLLTFGYMIGDRTLIEKVKKIPPGSMLVFGPDGITLEKYFSLKCTPYIEDDEQTIIKNLDKLFRNAVYEEYSKDEEYGYQHLVSLSGGLDSRTTFAYAKDENFDNITGLTYSDSGYLDDHIARNICRDFKCKYIFVPLDNGNYLTENIDEIIRVNNGMVLYSGAAHSYHSYKQFSFSIYGMVHTGQIGDLILGSYLRDKKHHAVDDDAVNLIAYSRKLMPKCRRLLSISPSDYENDELFAFYEKCVNGVFNGYRMIEPFTEYSSPFLNPDLLDYAMKIHPSLRYKEKIYLKWLNKAIPSYMKYKWERYNISPRYPLLVMRAYKKLWRLKRKIVGDERRYSMNPIEYWYKTNKNLSKTIYSYYENNNRVLKNNRELYEDARELFETGSFMEKTQVITLLVAVRQMGISVR